MRLHELILDEGVVLAGPRQLAAYAVVVAEAYDAAPRHDASASKLWHQLADHNRTVLLRQIARAGVKVIRQADDPYSADTDDPKTMIRYMLWDMVVNKILRIYTGHSDDHSVFTPDDNVIFRTVHDYFAHGVLRAKFKTQLPPMTDRPTPAELTALLPNINLSKGGNIGHGFTLRGEMNAYSTHLRLTPPQVAPALFTEIIGQACYQTIVHSFPQQKVAILRDFDYKQVGVMRPGSAAADRFAVVKDDLLTASFASTITAQPTIHSAALLRTIGRD